MGRGERGRGGGEERVGGGGSVNLWFRCDVTQ